MPSPNPTFSVEVVEGGAGCGSALAADGGAVETDVGFEVDAGALHLIAVVPRLVVDAVANGDLIEAGRPGYYVVSRMELVDVAR